MKKLLSFAIPCYNSASTIGFVIDEIEKVFNNSEKYDYEIVTVVDGSPDNVYDVLADLASKNQKIKVVKLSKNFGQPNARMATLKYSSGDYIICMDDDGQCPTGEAKKLVESLENGNDYAIADYPKKKQSLFKNFGSFINKITTRFLLDVPKNFKSSNYFAIKKYIRDQVINYDNPYPYVDGLVSQVTKKIDMVPMEERERLSGETNYTFRKLVSFWLNSFTTFSVKPLRLSSFIGAICAIAGFVFGLITIIRRIANPHMYAGWSSIIAILLFIGGMVMIMLGLIGEYIGRIYISLNDKPQYVVEDILNIEKDV